MFVSLFLVVGSLILGQALALEGYVFYEPPDSQVVEANLRLFLSSKRETAEFFDSAWLLRRYYSHAFSNAIHRDPKKLITPIEPEELTPLVLRVRNALVRRGLECQDRYTRRQFIYIFDELMFDRPLEQLPLLRDALNDPDEQLRLAAAEELREWIGNATSSGTWSPKAHKRLKPRIEVYLDEVADLLIWKGLTDAERWSDFESVLYEIDPNQHRIRSLQRALASGMIRDPQAIERAERLLEHWDPIYAAGKEGERRAQNRAAFDAVPMGADPFAPK